ncbi:PREDICTED: uncharacterized protein LOC109313115 [Crocodylus porosus]|uniref:uncharacterized protein LOC109313115 n=1 Tax=Crocodylus porosus TaxID=8502 RepID=UPI000938BF6B|nr:PREDICTED: uncharacterized protein LOC109313115 [Crocodylus porosus]
MLPLALGCLWLLLQRLAVAAVSMDSQCGAAAVLPCSPAAKGMQNFWASGWYKVVNSSQEMGLIRNLKNRTTVYDKIQRQFLMDEQQSLVIPKVRPEDAGTYRCSLWANVGHFNQQADVILRVSDCSAPWLGTSPTGTSPRGPEREGSTSPNSTCCREPLIPVLAAVLGLLAFSVGKGLLSIILILVIRVSLKYKRRRKQVRNL